MTRNTHVPIFKRRRTGQTDYSKRKSMIISRSVILSIRISNKHSTFQFIEPKIEGDLVKSSSHSSQITKLDGNARVKVFMDYISLDILQVKKQNLQV